MPDQDDATQQHVPCCVECGEERPSHGLGFDDDLCVHDECLRRVMCPDEYDADGWPYAWHIT
jgi:hypothetical protein